MRIDDFLRLSNKELKKYMRSIGGTKQYENYYVDSGMYYLVSKNRVLQKASESLGITGIYRGNRLIKGTKQNTFKVTGIVVSGTRNRSWLDLIFLNNSGKAFLKISFDFSEMPKLLGIETPQKKLKSLKELWKDVV